MGNPAEHEARSDAERRGVLVGSDVDLIEAGAIADAAGDEPEQWGSWLCGERVPA